MRNLLEAAKGVLSGQQLDEAAKGSMPTTEKEKSLAKLAEPKDKITHKDVLVGRGVLAKEDADVEGFEDIGLTEEEMNNIAEKYMGYEKLKGELQARGAKNPAGLAAWIGRKKYGKEKFQKAAAAGKKMQSEDVEQIDEISKSTYVNAVKSATDPMSLKGNADKIISRAAKQQGAKFASDLGGIERKSHFPRAGQASGTDKLAQRTMKSTNPANVTKAGKLNKTVVKGLKSNLKEDEIEYYEADETIISENAFTIEIPENIQYKDYVQAVLNLEGFASLSDIPEDRMNGILECIDIAHKENLVDIVIESLSWSQMQDKIAAHKKAGAKVMDVTQGTRQGKPYAAYTVIDKQGMKRRHIYHGSTSKIENMGQTTKPGAEE